jgi:hypothetical protein
MKSPHRQDLLNHYTRKLTLSAPWVTYVDQLQRVLTLLAQRGVIKLGLNMKGYWITERLDNWGDILKWWVWCQMSGLQGVCSPFTWHVSLKASSSLHCVREAGSVSSSTIKTRVWSRNCRAWCHQHTLFILFIISLSLPAGHGRNSSSLLHSRVSV